MVYCVPLNDLLYSLGVNHVDFLSLDVQGVELSILSTVDFNAVRIDLIILEAATAKHKSDLRAFFASTGLYNESSEFRSRNDLMFERTDLK